jgi:hypothetical protein
MFFSSYLLLAMVDNEIAIRANLIFPPSLPLISVYHHPLLHIHPYSSSCKNSKAPKFLQYQEIGICTIKEIGKQAIKVVGKGIKCKYITQLRS